MAAPEDARAKMIPPPTSNGCRPPRHGFTLVEIMVVVVIIGLLAALALPAFKRVQRRTENSRFVSDLRTLSQAFETYAIQNGSWPPSASAGEIPAGMAEELRSSVWLRPNTLGGRWEWNINANGFAAALVSTAGTASDEQWGQVDAMIESFAGNALHNGAFRKVGGKYLYVLAQ